MSKNAIFIRGLNGVMDDAAAIEWAKKREFDLKIFNWQPMAPIVTYINKLRDPIDLIGFSKGAEIAYAVAQQMPHIWFDRMITVGAYHTVTSSFGTKRRPRLINVAKHWNFVEKFQQPEGFFNNPINIDLGDVSHFNSLKKALGILDTLK